MSGPIYIGGASASGKSALALELALRLGGEVVNADAFQLYCGIPILTAAPSAEDQERVPHHLYGVLSPADSINAGEYARMASAVIQRILDRGVTPIVCGGSGLYLKFLTHGSSALPTADAALRAEMETKPLDVLVAELRSLDPAEAERISLLNRRYVERALEICICSGRRASDLRREWTESSREREADLRGIWVCRERGELHERIATRTREMLQSGAIEEVGALGQVSATCEKAIGLREIRELLHGRIDLERCCEKINVATRQYAKRQETWFRREKWMQPYTAQLGNLSDLSFL
ncbi:MAG: tRNA (adenosine(37)-N6)-dimethylallyltransferase MiaA [Luteolibacter sp.]